MGDGQPSDREVILRCRRGEIELFRLLVERYQDRLYHLAFRLLGNAEDARDAAQESFVRAYGALSRFDPERPFGPWIARIAANTCIAMLRRRRPEVSLQAMEDEEADRMLLAAGHPAQGDPQQGVLLMARDEAIQRAVLALPEPYRSVVLLRYSEEMSYDAIAQALELPLGTVKTYLHRARLRLQKTLTEE